MKCPNCNATETQVRDSRPTAHSTRRRRRCAECEHRFTTHEITVKREAGAILTVDRNGNVSPPDQKALLTMLRPHAGAHDERGAGRTDRMTPDEANEAAWAWMRKQPIYRAWLVYRLLLERDCTKQELIDQLDLTLPEVVNAIRYLDERGLVMMTDEVVDTGRGPPSHRFRGLEEAR